MTQSVLMLSGLLCDDTVWNGLTPALASDVSIHLRDFRGFDDLGRMAESVLADAPPRFALVGHSMGARVALEIYQRAPQRVERLALLDTGVHPAKPGEAAGRQRLIELAQVEGMTALAREWLPPMVHPAFATDPRVMQPLVAMVERMTPAIYVQQVRALLNRPDARALLPTISCPTLIGVGREDRWSPLEQHQEMAAQIPQAHLEIFERSGHMAPYEAPDQVANALRAWLAA